MTDLYQLAAKVIAQFEGFTPVAEWDVNAYRLGYGSDTEGPDQTPVKKGMTTTQDRALANLALRIPQYETQIVSQVGAGPWSRLSDNTKAALLSFCYNYGSLTPGLAVTVRNGMPASAIAMAIQARAGDNRGINAHRRQAEATLARTPDAAPPAPTLDLTDVFAVLDALEKLGYPNPIKAFQKKEGLDVDGDPGPQTQAAIAKELSGG